MSEKKKKAVNRKALRLIKTELSLDRFSMYIQLDPEDGSYEDDVKIIKLLFNDPDPDYKMALWNGIYLVNTEIDQSVFTEAEWGFLCERGESIRQYYDCFNKNINKPIKTDRLVIRPATRKDNDLYHQYLKTDGDFTMFTCRKYSKAAAHEYTLLRPLFFSVCERSTDEPVGYAGLVWGREDGKSTGVVTLEYYIFKKYRRMGYAREAVTELCARALDGKLYELHETNYDSICKKSRSNIKVIRAYIRSDNEPSKGLAESCGFIHSGTLHRDFFVEGVGAVDKEVYELFR